MNRVAKVEIKFSVDCVANFYSQSNREQAILFLFTIVHIRNRTCDLF